MHELDRTDQRQINIFARLKSLAEEGHAPAQYNFGRQYINIEDANSWIKLAADQGFPPAQECLAWRQSFDELERRRLHVLAANQGYPLSQQALGRMLWGEKNIANDGGATKIQAIVLYLLAARHGHREAKSNLQSLLNLSCSLGGANDEGGDPMVVESQIERLQTLCDLYKGLMHKHNRSLQDGKTWAGIEDEQQALEKIGKVLTLCSKVSDRLQDDSLFCIGIKSTTFEDLSDSPDLASCIIHGKTLYSIGPDNVAIAQEMADNSEWLTTFGEIQVHIRNCDLTDSVKLVLAHLERADNDRAIDQKETRSLIASIKNYPFNGSNSSCQDLIHLCNDVCLTRKALLNDISDTVAARTKKFKTTYLP